MTAYLLVIVITLDFYLVSVVETVIHEPGDEGGLSNCNDTVTDVFQRDTLGIRTAQII